MYKCANCGAENIKLWRATVYAEEINPTCYCLNCLKMTFGEIPFCKYLHNKHLLSDIIDGPYHYMPAIAKEHNADSGETLYYGLMELYGAPKVSWDILPEKPEDEAITLIDIPICFDNSNEEPETLSERDVINSNES